MRQHYIVMKFAHAFSSIYIIYDNSHLKSIAQDINKFTRYAVSISLFSVILASISHLLTTLSGIFGTSTLIVQHYLNAVGYFTSIWHLTSSFIIPRNVTLHAVLRCVPSWSWSLACLSVPLIPSKPTVWWASLPPC